MATPPFHTALLQLEFVHQVYVIVIRRIRRVSHLAASSAVSNQLIIVHASDEASTIIHIDPRLGHLFSKTFLSTELREPLMNRKLPVHQIDFKSHISGTRGRNLLATPENNYA
jgi:hypothetical protein